MRLRLLIVEDDRQLVEMLTELFQAEGYAVDRAWDGQRGLHLALTQEYQVCIIDLGLPAIDGLDLLTRLRRQGITTPILLLTARGAVADRVAGLDAGAEDYLVKPFEIDELLARVRALHRRHLDHAAVLPLGAARIDVSARTIRLPDGKQVTPARREFELLCLLARRPKRVHTRAELRAAVCPDTTSESIVDTYVYYLRRRLGRSVIRTVPGIGYRIGEL